MPTDIEWAMLEMHLGMSQEETGSRGFRGTNEGSQLASNENLWRDRLGNDGEIEASELFGTSGFLALPAGYRVGEDLSYSDFGGSGQDKSGRNLRQGRVAAFWTSDDYGPNNFQAKARRIVHYSEQIFRSISQSNDGLSVRCIRDE